MLPPQLKMLTPETLPADTLPRFTSTCSDTTAHTFAPTSPWSSHSQVSESVLFEQTKRMMSLHGCRPKSSASWPVSFDSLDWEPPLQEMQVPQRFRGLSSRDSACEVSESVLFDQTKRMMSLHGCRPKSSADIVGQKPFILEANGIDSFDSLDWEPPLEEMQVPNWAFDIRLAHLPAPAVSSAETSRVSAAPARGLTSRDSACEAWTVALEAYEAWLHRMQQRKPT